MVVVIDGSAWVTVAHRGSGGFYEEDDPETLRYPPLEEPQTNNRAELRVVAHVLRHKPAGRRVSIVMDANYVYKGLTELVFRWEGRSGKARFWGLMRVHPEEAIFFWVLSHGGIGGMRVQTARLLYVYNTVSSAKCQHLGSVGLPEQHQQGRACAKCACSVRRVGCVCDF